MKSDIKEALESSPSDMLAITEEPPQTEEVAVIDEPVATEDAPAVIDNVEPEVTPVEEPPVGVEPEEEVQAPLDLEIQDIREITKFPVAVRVKELDDSKSIVFDGKELRLTIDYKGDDRIIIKLSDDSGTTMSERLKVGESFVAKGLKFEVYEITEIELPGTTGTASAVIKFTRADSDGDDDAVDTETQEPDETDVEDEMMCDIPAFSDLRGGLPLEMRINLDDCDFSEASKRYIGSMIFDTSTDWPALMPQGFSPLSIIEKAKNPGLGVTELHDEGIDGKGINVAIIDQPLQGYHPEFRTIVDNYDVDSGSTNSMHGPSVASLLVGKTIGVAPGANLYYVSAPSWKADSSYYARALDYILEENTQLPSDNKIRVVSISANPSGLPFKTNYDQWNQAVTRAKAAGIIVLTAGDDSDIEICRSWYDFLSYLLFVSKYI